MDTSPDNDILRVLDGAELLFTEDQVEKAYDDMALAIGKSLGNKNPLVVSVMMGGLIPTARLAERFDFPHQLDYLHATRYQGYTEGGELSWIAQPRLPLEDRVVLVVDDVLDHGVTLASIVDDCRQQGAKDVRIVVLVKKRHKSSLGQVKADFFGLEVEDQYLIGCGMDYKEYWRHLPSIYGLKEGP